MQLNVASAPLIIEINHGIETTPHETGDVDKTISSSFVRTIEASDIRESHFDLSKAIENESGIKIRRIGGTGGYAHASIRGKSSDQLMIYIDGLLINNASGGGVDLSQIPINQIQRIEIYKDNIPIEFSEASNGGVINIISHRTKNQKSKQINTSVGSFTTFNLSSNYFNHYKKWNFVFSGGYTESKNDFPFIFEENTPENPVGDEEQNRFNNELQQYNVQAKAKHSLNKNETFLFQTELFSKQKNIPSFSNNPETRASLNFDNKNIGLNYINTLLGSKNLELNFGLKTSINDTRYDDQLGQIGLSNLIADQKTKTITSKAYIKYKKNNYQLIFNNNARYEYISHNTKNINPNDFSDISYILKSNKRVTLSTALEGHFYFQDKRLIISPASRIITSKDNFSGKTVSETSDKQNLSKQQFTVSPKIGARYQLWHFTNLKMNAGKYYRQPNYIELFGTQGFIGSNESLLPEEGINFDIGFEHLTFPKSEILTKLNWDFSLYHSIINNEISYSFDARGIGKPSNNSKSTITGFENSLELEFDYAIDLTSNTTLQLPLNKSDPNNTKLLTGRSILIQNTHISTKYGSMKYFFEHNWESFYYYDSEQRNPSTNKSIFNGGIKYYTKKIETSLELNNIFNHQYKDYQTQASPGTSIFLSIMFHSK